MAVQDKKIGSLTEWVYGNIADTANIVVAYAGANYRIVMSTLKQYVLGNRTIDGIGPSDIPTNSGVQTFTNKRLNNPAFNSDTTLNIAVTATQMNYLQNLDVNVKQALDSVGAYAHELEDSILDLMTAVNVLQADKIYSEQHSASGGQILLTAAEISGGNPIDPKSLSISVYEYSFGTQGVLTLLNLSGIVVSTSGSNLSNVTIANVTVGMTYQIVIRYRLKV